MQLTYYTDYSLRVLMYLAIRRDRIATISEIAECYSISRNHLVKVVHNLARGGFIKSYRGKGGGIELARDLKSINIGEVVRYRATATRAILATTYRASRESSVAEIPSQASMAC